MPAIVITVLIAFFVICGALVCLGVGYLLTGKPKIKPGACGRDPHKIREEGCGTSASCQLCDQNEDNKPKSPKEPPNDSV